LSVLEGPALNSDPQSSSVPPKLNATVDRVVRCYLATIDAEAPGLIEGFYLVSSVALGDFRPHESDVDFVAVMADRPDPAMIDALRRMHRHIQNRYPRPYFDGVYVTWEDLGRDPGLCVRAPTAHEGRLELGDFEPNPVTWQTLAHHEVVIRGPAPSELAVWHDPDVLAAWTTRYLHSYWRPWHRRFSHPFSVAGLKALGSWAPAWGVLGVSRLHYTLATGEITSKEGAGLGTRRTRRDDAAAFIEMVIEDAHRL